MQAWRHRAEKATRALQGRTPARLIEALIATPALSSEMAAELTGASRAAILRNLTWFEENHLIREMTGQGRFRFWTVR